jgi:uncharacterized membrane protein (DUF373 family)
MPLMQNLKRAGQQWQALQLYAQFERAVILLLTGLIAIVIVAAVWNLTLTIVFRLVISDNFDPTDHAIFQDIFGRIFTVIIALEFKWSLLVVSQRKNTVVQVRAVILIAMLAIVRKLIILDLAKTDAMQLLALSATILALGVVFWLVRDQDRRDLG